MAPQKPQDAPDFIPAGPDFIPATGEPQPPAPPHPGIIKQAQNKFDALVAPKLHSKDQGILGNAGTAGLNVGKGILSTATPVVHPLQSVGATGFKGITDPWEQSKHDPTALLQGYEGQEPLAGMAQGFKQHPLESVEQLGGQILGGMGLAKAIPAIGEAIPSKSRSGAILEDIRSQAANTPVVPVETSGPLARFQELGQRGGASSKPATQLARRLIQNTVPTQNTPSFNFPEARDFYSNISSQSAEDASRLNPIMRRQMGEVRAGLHSDLTNAAGQIGRGEDYANAIREYARAAKLQNALKTAAKIGIPTAIGGGILGTVARKVLP